MLAAPGTRRQQPADPGDPNGRSLAAPANRFLRLLAAGVPIMADGPMGTRLAEAGLSPGQAPEAWLLEPRGREAVRGVHRAYREAGARILLTDSFGGSPARLVAHGLGGRVAELNRVAAEVARAEAAEAGAERPVVVAGSIGPTGELLAPLGSLSEDEAADGFAEQAAALAAGGADVLWIETMSDLAEVEAAVTGCRRGAPELPVVATLTFGSRGATVMGVRPAAAAAALVRLGVAAGGVNCGSGSADVEPVVAAMHAAAPALVLVAKPNAGLPRVEAGQTVYPETPAEMAIGIARLRDAGAAILGSCCGGSPDHLRAIAAMLRTDG